MGEESEIQKFYKDKKILITGASGFIGKVLLWKLLNSCSSVDTIYVLIRSKRGQDIQTRLENLLEAPIYDNFKKDNPKVLEKIVPISGDISIDDLDLSKCDKDTLVNQVSIIFHIAAALNMDAELKNAVNMNTQGTLRMLKLALEMKNLKVFVHTSTAYCYCDKDVTDETVSPPLEDPMDIIHLTKWMPSHLLKQITPGLVSPHPNTYTYTKRLSEKLVADHYPQLPVVIARPSIVIPSIKEPVPGWVDNLNGPVGLLIAGGKGVLRTMLCDGDSPANMVAVDVVCNGLIAAAWHSSTQPNKSETVPVYNLTTTETEPILWHEVIDIGKDVIEEYPFETVLWYPGGGMTPNKYIYTICTVLFHWIPAYFIDFLLMIFGQKPFMVHVHNKLYQGQKVLNYFTTRTWQFTTDNLLRLKQCMNTTDQEIFPVTMKYFVDRYKYFEHSVKITRRYILKEDPASIPQCRKKMKMLYILDCFVRFIGILLLFWLGITILVSFIKYFDLEN